MTDSPVSLQQLLKDTRNILSFHGHCGLDYPLSPELQKFLDQVSRQPPKGRKPPRPRPTFSHKQAPVKGKQPAPPTPEATSTTLADLAHETTTCRRCKLSDTSKRLALGQGPKKPGGLFIVCDSPDDDTEQAPIAGEARQLLIKMLAAIQLQYTDVYITTITKCIPDGKATSCLPFLLRQLDIIKPKVICAMGQIASQTLLGSSKPLFALRGRFYDFNSTPLMPTFPPALLLKHQEMKKGAWHDLQMIQKKLA